jgi:hypothetical protein
MNQDPSYPGTQQFALHRIIDELHQGMIVSTFEHPKEWLAHSQVVWNFEDTGYPLMAYASTFNPNGTEAFELLPVEACFWVQPNYMYTSGQRYRGLTCLPPMSGLDALVQFAIPKYRGNRQNLRLVYAQPVPNLAQMLGADELRNVQHEGVMARIEYGENGRLLEEEFYACVMWHPPNGQQTNWGLTRLFCFRAARGQLDMARQQFWRIATSVRNNPQWGQVFDQIIRDLNAQVMAFLDGVKAKLAAEIDYGRKLTEYRAWQADLSQQQFNSRWASNERRNEQVGDILLGRQRFDDPSNVYGNPHFNYGHQQYAWTNGRGEWIHKDKASYNPNSDPNTLSRGPWYWVEQS